MNWTKDDHRLLMRLLVLALFVGIFVTVIGWNVTTAAPAPLAAPAVQAGTAVINTAGSVWGHTNITYDFPGDPVIVVTLKTQVGVKYVQASAFSSTRGEIALELDEAADYPIEVNWIATMPTGTAVEEDTNGR